MNCCCFKSFKTILTLSWLISFIGDDILWIEQKWKSECDDMDKTLSDAKASAGKMTVHDDPDTKHAGMVKRWEVIDATAKDWIKKLEDMVGVWKKQAETAEKVTAAIAAGPGGGAPDQEMKLEDLEKHLDNLKQMFIEKQKMMEQAR